MPKRKKKGETIVETSASPTESRYSRRSRKKVNYNENIAKNEEKENEDSDFENEKIQRKNGYIKDSEDDYGSESSDDDKPLKKTKSAPTNRKKSILKNINSTENSRSFSDQDSYKQITGFVARPNLSEDESSESESEGEIPLKKNKNVLEESARSATMSRKNESFQKSAPVVKIDISEVDKLQFGRNYKIKKDKSNESLAEVPNKVLERSNEIDTSDTGVAPQKEKTAKNKQERKDIENKRKRNLSNKESEVPISKRSKQQVEFREIVTVSEIKTDNKRTRLKKGETKEKKTLKEAGKKNVNLKKVKLSRSAQKNKANEEDTRRERLKPEDVQVDSEESEDNWEDVDGWYSFFFFFSCLVLQFSVNISQQDLRTYLEVSIIAHFVIQVLVDPFSCSLYCVAFLLEHMFFIPKFSCSVTKVLHCIESVDEQAISCVCFKRPSSVNFTRTMLF